jgi:DNA uptake protein ComE-like DNA-binding protein
MKFFESHFWYNKDQRNGILLLVILIIIFQSIYIFADFSNDDAPYDDYQLSIFQHKIDSIKNVQNKTIQRPKFFPFNPNYITDFKGYQLGMSVDEIDNLLEFRKTGKFINSTLEFQKITKISDSLLNNISPYFKFPDWVSNPKIVKKIPSRYNKNIVKKDLNAVSEENLIKIQGIGQKLAKRIIDYRELLGGYTFDDQLYEVYYLDKSVADRVLNDFKVMEKPIIDKININNATFKEVLHLPYIDYNLTKKIFNYRDEVQKILNLEELKKIDSFPLNKFDRITLYLVTD